MRARHRAAPRAASPRRASPSTPALPAAPAVCDLDWALARRRKQQKAQLRLRERESAGAPRTGVGGRVGGWVRPDDMPAGSGPVASHQASRRLACRRRCVPLPA